jgi:hypothetical protein
MTVAEFGRRQFLRLPASARRRILQLAARRAPWDDGFDFAEAPDASGLETGPPHFVGVGVQRAGTTWWYELLARHPEVYTHPELHKERHFFTRFWREEFQPGHAAEYHAWFPRPSGMVTGEWTPDYLHHPWSLPLLRRSAPGAKLLVLLRDPVERYQSGLAHMRRQGRTLNAMAATDAFSRGNYATELARAEALFGPEQILVLQYERCRDDTARCLRETFAFLGLDESFDPGVRGERGSSSNGSGSLSAARRALLVEQYQDEVGRLVRSRPEIDLDRWPNFSSSRQRGE